MTNPTYSAMHRRTVRRRGPAKTHACSHCAGPATDWAYDHADPAVVHGVGTGKSTTLLPYSLDPMHYVPLCGRCHRIWDEAHGQVSAVTKRETCKRGHPNIPENRYPRPNGTDQCAICARLRAAGSKAGQQ